MGKFKQIETEIWVANLEKPGYLKMERKKTVQEVFDELVTVLKEQEVYGEMDYFQISVGNDKKGDFPVFRWIACFAVEGGSEGHYIHIEVITPTGETETIFLGKTFLGIEHALKVSNICTQSFYR
ncbi:hypothetical protein CVD28_01285 [Bacillus sp. M6-12]|uniref:hypothetical protein n=1 Tax=Bacillus sp. M6-12 TaxID=2054166 RepID=UPI000C759EC8|nr:hypothetical protein [Bacillus sp. M6-12]PLS19067.1 hypothetical protein CVD28_01285 [Bacillus sp. M6-12]